MFSKISPLFHDVFKPEIEDSLLAIKDFLETLENKNFKNPQEGMALFV